MESLSIPLALIDLLPVILSGLGMFLIARLITRLDRNCGHLASLGFLLVTLGGLFNTLWKLILVTTELHSPVLKHSLLILLAPGFVLMAWAIWKTFHSGPSGTPVWVVPVILIVVGCGAAAISALSKGGQRWFFILLGLMTIGHATTSFLLAWQARRRGLRPVAALFLVSFGLVFLQAGTAWMLRQMVAMSWLEPIINTLGWATFAYAAWQLEQAMIQKHLSVVASR